MCNHHKDKRFGSALEHGSAHTEDHRRWSRRAFIRSLGLAGGGAALVGGLPVRAFGASPLSLLLGQNFSDHILVIIRLAGGNDGLNTFVPLYDYDTYANLRPTLRIPESQLIQLDGDFGMPNFMQSLNPLWQEGRMKVVNTVGYPGQNLSHFRSTDIWDSASDADVLEDSGWLGRVITQQYPDLITNPPETPPAIQIGGVGHIAFNNENQFDLSFSVTSPEELQAIAQNGQLYDPNDVPACYVGEQISFLRAVTNNTFTYADVIAEAYDQAANSVQYAGDLGEQLAIVARLIKGGLKTPLYMVTIAGFDTHAIQTDLHRQLLTEVADQVKNFFDDLQNGGRSQDVLCMTISEFGRRIEENGSQGTDHGAAAPLLLFGEGLNGNGFLGEKPDLHDVDEVGNLKFSVDFRQIYASVLQNWLCLDAAQVDLALGRHFPRLDLGIQCSVTATEEAPPVPRISSEVRYGPNGEIEIHYTLPFAARVSARVFDMIGQPVAELERALRPAGEHKIVFRPERRLPSGIYVVRLLADDLVVSKQFRLVR